MGTKSFYQPDLAYIHDTSFGQIADAAAHEILSRLDPAAQPLVVDLGCGSGILAEQLTKAGCRCIGVDYSKSILEIARQRAPKATFQRASFLDYEFPPCQAVTAIGEVFTYQFDERNSLQTLQELWTRIYRQLLPGGYLIFDLLEPGMLNGAPEFSRIAEGKDWTIFVHYKENVTARTFSRDITAFRRIGDLYRKSNELHQVNTFDREEVLATLRAIGFQVELTKGYGGTEFRPGHIGFVAQKTKA